MMASLDSTKVATREQISTILFAGVDDNDSQLSLLRGMPHILDRIFRLATNEPRWKRCIRLPDVWKNHAIVEKYKNRKGVYGNTEHLFLTQVQYNPKTFSRCLYLDCDLPHLLQWVISLRCRIILSFYSEML